MDLVRIDGRPIETADIKPIFDDKGRKSIPLMSDREIIEEMLTQQRATRDLVETFILEMNKNPLMSMMATRFGKKNGKTQ